MFNNEQPAKMWSGRFRKSLNATFESWQRAFPFDWRLIPQEVASSRAHTRALAAAGIFAITASTMMLLPARAQTTAVAPGIAEPALVTFYTHGPRSISGLPGTKAIFYGNIFDGEIQLFSFRPGFVYKNNLHLTLRFPAGPHNFKAFFGTDASAKQPLHLDLRPGAHYYVKASADEHGIVIFDWQSGQIEAVRCGVAQAEIAKSKGKVLQPRKVSPAVSAMILSDQTLAPCP